jgi:hypothetical protein
MCIYIYIYREREREREKERKKERKTERKRVSQEERSIFWEVTVSVILSNKIVYVRTCILFRTVSEIKVFYCTVPKLLIRKKYYILFLIPVFIVQVK